MKYLTTITAALLLSTFSAMAIEPCPFEVWRTSLGKFFGLPQVIHPPDPDPDDRPLPARQNNGGWEPHLNWRSTDEDFEKYGVITFMANDGSVAFEEWFWDTDPFGTGPLGDPKLYVGGMAKRAWKQSRMVPYAQQIFPTLPGDYFWCILQHRKNPCGVELKFGRTVLDQSSGLTVHEPITHEVRIELETYTSRTGGIFDLPPLYDTTKWDTGLYAYGFKHEDIPRNPTNFKEAFAGGLYFYVEDKFWSHDDTLPAP